MYYSMPGFPVLSSRVCSNSCPLSQWCHSTISSSVTPFSSCPQSFSESESFPMSRLFPSGSQRFGTSASASVLLVNIQDGFPLGVTGLISLQSKGLSRVFSNTTVWKHQLLSTQPSLRSNSHICTWLLETIWPFSAKWYSCFLIHCLGLSQLFFQGASFNFMAAVSIWSDFGAQENKVYHCIHCFPIYLPWSDGTRFHGLHFLNAEF